ncbi:hypothetical protein AJ80_05326 [Polytolypa hystricis UAMH7299]|uniref:Uncharacterized protein n=1 Tax=Polytolypa hystricis (strain UAMH7299) TaxID=1447883 RepID=A0A2B7Y534_POLH7|nr:hypothetical protein AJ80_05326 [Polytolypa hystricis UAMH7299]
MGDNNNPNDTGPQRSNPKTPSLLLILILISNVGLIIIGALITSRLFQIADFVKQLEKGIEYIPVSVRGGSVSVTGMVTGSVTASISGGYVTATIPGRVTVTPY